LSIIYITTTTRNTHPVQTRGHTDGNYNDKADGNIWKPSGQSWIDNPETLVILGTQCTYLKIDIFFD
jgi:hypothetical protein